MVKSICNKIQKNSNKSRKANPKPAVGEFKRVVKAAGKGQPAHTGTRGKAIMVGLPNKKVLTTMLMKLSHIWILICIL